MSLQPLIERLVEEHTSGRYTLHDSSKGLQLRVHCPFHSDGQERHPSFFWNVDNGLFFCQACEASGGLPDFLRLMGYDRELTSKMLNEVDYASIRRAVLRRSAFARKRGQSALTVNPVLEEWLLASYDYTPMHMVNRGFSRELLREYEVGYDLEHHRVIFSLRDVYGRLVGLSGRKDGGLPGELRYKFYEGEIASIVPNYHLEKGHLLWNAHRLWAKYVTGYVTHQHYPVVVLVEGYKAALHMIQLGFLDTVALMGASMTEVQRYILSTIGGDVLIFLDNNRAGRTGSLKILRELREHSTVRPFLLTYPADAEDSAQPDSLTEEEIDTMITEVYR
ncbi:MAG: toprim domain-containing protein [Planctomycetes bacterium]|nr:toprim domain-containing protein [Planctomycetota bacterium]